MNDGLKQRLVGAIVLVAIAVLFLPSLFNRDTRRSVDVATQVPPEPVAVTEVLDVPEPEQPDNIVPAKPLEENYSHEAPGTESAAADDPDVSGGGPDFSESSEPEEAEPESQTAQRPTTDANQPEARAQTEAQTQNTAEAQNEPQPAAPELNDQGVPEAWSVQVGSFQSGERAAAMQERLLSEGYKTYIREGIGTQGVLHRVFVGPKVNKALAEADKRAIEEQLGSDALIVEFKP